MSAPQTQSAGVFVVGGGPAGLAAAIAARQIGLPATVADSLQPPIDKACGEGLMPGAVAALESLGIHFAPGEAIPFRGIRFLDAQTGLSTEAAFPRGIGLAVRRTVLHESLIERAMEAGAVIYWGARVTLEGGAVACDGHEVHNRWIVGADGQQSPFRKWAGLQPTRRESARFGFRQHFAVAPWTDFVEVYWGARCQIAVTPTGLDEVGLAMTSRVQELRMEQALREMPALAARIGSATPATRERGAPCTLRRLPAVHRGRFVLIGDASGSVDPVTGEGLGLAFRQALALAEALDSNDLRAYEAAHGRIGKLPRRMSQLVLAMDRSRWLRERALRAFAAEPRLFARLIRAHVDGMASSPLGLLDTLRLGWRVAAPGWPN